MIIPYKEGYPYLYRGKGMSSIQEKPKPLRLQRKGGPLTYTGEDNKTTTNS